MCTSGSDGRYKRAPVPAAAFDRHRFGGFQTMRQPTTHRPDLFDPRANAKAALAHYRRHADATWPGWDCVGMGV